MQYCNPKLLEDHNISLEKVLEDEAAGMAFPLDAKYFDDFPVIRGDMCDDIAGRQYPRPELAESIMVKSFWTVRLFPTSTHGAMGGGITSAR